MNERNKGIFYGVVAIATLIVAIVGATLAYFSIYAGSSENAVGLTSRVVSIDYSDGQNVVVQELIPSAYNYVVRSYESPKEGKDVCIDDNDQEICSVYQFTVKNNADAVNLEMYLRVGLNEFDNLKYMLYEINGNTKTNVYDSMNTIVSSNILSYGLTKDAIGQRFSLAGYNEDNGAVVVYPLASGDEKTFELVIYLNEIGSQQNDEQGKSFAGTIEVEVNGNITGYISD